MGHDLNGAVIWALVMNASRVRVLRGLTETAPTELISACPARHLRHILSGAPAQPARPTQAMGADLSEFVRETLRCLEILRRAGDFEYLALVAPLPVMICTEAEMPQRLGAEVRWRQTADLVAVPEPALRAAVLRLIATAPGS